MPFPQLVLPSGGGVSAPELESGVEVASSEAMVGFDLTNPDASAPYAVALAFSEGVLSAPSPDRGTASAPVFALAAGETRAVTLARTTSGPRGEDDAITETITATGPGGVTATATVLVQALTLFWQQVRSNYSAGHFWTLTADTGGLLTDEAITYTAQHATYTGCARSTDQVVDLIDGSVVVQSGDRLHVSAMPRSETSWSATDRSMVILFELDGSSADTYLFVNQDAHQPGYVYFPAGGEARVYRPTSTQVGSLDTSGSHTGGGASEAVTNTSTGLLLLAMSYNNAAGSLTVRWKLAGHTKVGHSYFTVTGLTPPAAPSGTAVYEVYGWTSAGEPPGTFLGHGIGDAVVDAATFSAWLDALGMGGTA